MLNIIQNDFETANTTYLDAREMGMTEDEFFHSCPVFFCEQYEIFCEKKARMVRTLYGG